jgi:hypothetical protein
MNKRTLKALVENPFYKLSPKQQKEAKGLSDEKATELHNLEIHTTELYKPKVKIVRRRNAKTKEQNNDTTK